MAEMEKLKTDYAELVIRAGVNIQKGQRLSISSPVECADFARLCALKQKDPALAEELLQKIAGRVDDFPRDKAAFLRARERLFEALDA